ncbi:MAG: hypothetical protein NXI09_15700 [Bacteroidetes bacterium]|nr:hypothetical protein [Bacteroidota bacterium]
MKPKYLFSVLLFMNIYSCTEFQEKQLQEDAVEVFIPRDGLRTDVATQQFYWYELAGAEDYQLQVASPDFQEIERLVLDTIMTNTRLFLTLAPGDYEWRVRAFNNSSASLFSSRRLYIDSTLNLSNQTVQIVDPSDQDTSNKMSYKFRWQELYNADQYTVDLASDKDFSSIIQNWTVNVPELEIIVPSEGGYHWRVRAINPSSVSPYSSRSFFVDTTAPQVPLLVSPGNGQVLLGNSVNFLWQRQSAGISSVRDSLQISKDSLFSNSHVNLLLDVNSLNLDTLGSDSYFWRVQSIDKAFNSSDWSGASEFVIQ